MDNDRIKGAGKKIGGSVKETTGKITGDTKLEAKGAAEKTAGKVQEAAGSAKDTVRDTIKK